ncbi:MAG: T-complex 10 C-terminal domain-containing protein, partial [Clostridia bacterium]|nr:T-complex 10 C-terminal domain-containing protein [Clostridia bacterium]
MKRYVSFFLSLFMVTSLLVGLLPTISIYAADESGTLKGFDNLPDAPFSGNYSEFEGKDGSKTRVYDNGGVMTKYKDGSTTSVDYEGNRYSTAPDGSYTVRTRDGSSATEHADGRKSWTTPDGMTTTVNPDGSSSETFSNGLTKEYDTEGGLVGVGFVGSDERIGADEYGDYKDGRIEGPNGASMEVSDGGNTVKIVTPDGTRYEYTSTGIADSADGNKEITTITKPDGSTASVTETKHVSRDENGRTTGSTGSAVKEINVGGNKFQSEYITEYDPDGNPVYNPQNVTQFTGDDGSTYWTDNNSKAVEFNDPNTGERFCLDANGNIVDLVNGDVSVKTSYGADGNVVSSEWTWKDGAKYTVSGGAGTFVTPDGTTYTTDGKGNVYENGRQIKKDGEWVGGTKGSFSSDANDSKVENPLSDYYT